LLKCEFPGLFSSECILKIGLDLTKLEEEENLFAKKAGRSRKDSGYHFLDHPVVAFQRGIVVREALIDR